MTAFAVPDNVATRCVMPCTTPNWSGLSVFVPTSWVNAVFKQDTAALSKWSRS